MDLFSVVHRSFKNLAVPFRALTNARILPVVFPGFRASIHLRMLLFLLGCTSSPFNLFRPLGYFGPAFRHFPWGRMPSTVILRGSARPFHCFETIKFISKTSSWLTNTLGKLDRVTIPVIAKGISLSLSFRIYKLGVVTLGLLQDAVGVTGEKCVEALCQCYCCA